MTGPDITGKLPSRIMLIGPSGSGKSSVAVAIARRCGYQVVDVDQQIERRVDMPISEIFERFGESAFRVIERDELNAACEIDRAVVATGGGVVIDPANWSVMRPGSVIVGLMAEAETLVARVRAQETVGTASAIRPLLAGDPVKRMRDMLAARKSFYDRADAIVETDQLSIEETADAVVAAAIREHASGGSPILSFDSPLERSDIYIKQGSSSFTPGVIRRRWPAANTIWLITDANVAREWGDEIARSFVSCDFLVNTFVVPPGESSKSFDQVRRLCEEITGRGATRRDVVVALGGGVTGDLGGLVAAITLRGLPLVQMPTSLLAMVDSSVGGKTGINTPGGKNLVGAFYQPGIVIIDPRFLSTLSDDEYRSGMAEVIKHSYIQPSTPLGGLELTKQLNALTQLVPLPEDRIESILALNVAIKYSVVQADERESGLRMLLNFGHTAGHAIEADAYRHRHGEAVALGMLTVASIAEQQGRVLPGFTADMRETIVGAGLPTEFDGSADSIVERLARDKKNVDGRLHWIMPKVDGGVEIVNDIDRAEIYAGLKSIGAS